MRTGTSWMHSSSECLAPPIPQHQQKQRSQHHTTTTYAKKEAILSTEFAPGTPSIHTQPLDMLVETMQQEILWLWLIGSVCTLSFLLFCVIWHIQQLAPQRNSATDTNMFRTQWVVGVSWSTLAHVMALRVGSRHKGYDGVRGLTHRRLTSLLLTSCESYVHGNIIDTHDA